MIHIEYVQIAELPTWAPRRLYIYLPDDYNFTERRYPVLYMFDGHNVFYDSHATFGKSWGMNEYLSQRHVPVIIAAIECNTEGERRMEEYNPWAKYLPECGDLQTLGNVTMDWMSGTLKQSIDQRYRTLSAPEHTMIAGSSMAALMALYAASKYNGIYRRAAAISPYFPAGGPEMHKLFTETPLAGSTRIYMDIGTEEVSHEDHHMLAELFDCAAELTRAGAQVAARVVPDAIHNEYSWEKRIPIFMNYLLGDDAPL